MYYLGEPPQLHANLLVDAQKRWEGYLRTGVRLKDEEIKALLKKKGGKEAVEFYEGEHLLPA